MALRDLVPTIRAFFRRPVEKGDFRLIWKVVRRRAAVPKRPDFDETRIYKRPDPLEGWQATDKSLEVHEAPLDTLPDELRDELLGRKGSSRP